MLTDLSFTRLDSGIRVTVKRTGLPSHGHWSIHGYADGWCLQWAYREGLGTRYDKPWPQHRGLASRKDAEALKRQLRADGATGWNGPPAPPEIP